LKRIATLQLADAARLEPHVFVEMMKSPALVPPTLMLLKVTAFGPPLVTAMLFDAPRFPIVTLSHERLDGLTMMLVVDGIPVPDRVIDCGLLLAVSLIVTVALRIPVVVGLKRIVRVQLADAARVEPQVLAEIRKSVGFAPPITALVIVIDALPLFVSVAVLEPLVFPTATTDHIRVDGLIDA